MLVRSLGTRGIRYSLFAIRYSLFRFAILMQLFYTARIRMRVLTSLLITRVHIPFVLISFNGRTLYAIRIQCKLIIIRSVQRNIYGFMCCHGWPTIPNYEWKAGRVHNKNCAQVCKTNFLVGNVKMFLTSPIFGNFQILAVINFRLRQLAAHRN